MKLNASVWFLFVKNTFLLNCLLFLLIIACNSDNINDKGSNSSILDKSPMIIDIDRDFNNEREFRLSEIAYDIEYIKLEATPESLIGRGGRHLIITRDYIYLYNHHRLLQFNRTGKFVRQIGKEGRGPGEVQGFRNMLMDKDRNIIYVLDNLKHEVHQYDATTGEFLGSFPRSEYIGSVMNAGAFQLIEKGIFAGLTSHFMQFHPEYVLLELFDEQGNVVKKYGSHLFSYKDEEKTEQGHMVLTNQTWIFEDQLRLFEGTNDTIYKLVDLDLEPQYIFNLGKYKGPFDVMINPRWDNTRRHRYVAFHSFRETNSALFFFTRYENERSVSKYDKKDGQFYRLVNPREEQISIYNDIDGGISFWPYYMEGQMDSEWYMILDAINMKQNLTPEYIESSEAVFPDKKEHLKEFLEGLSIDDNPVLMIVKLKD